MPFAGGKYTLRGMHFAEKVLPRKVFFQRIAAMQRYDVYRGFVNA
jgi:hypothetical protein